MLETTALQAIAWTRDRLQGLYASEHRFVIVVLTASVLLKIPLILQVGGGEAQTVWGHQHGDVNRYLDQAASALEGDLDLEVKGHPARHGPVYPAFLASAFRVFGPHSYDVVRVLQLLVFALASAALYDIGRAAWGRGIGNWILGLCVVWFNGFYWSSELLTEVCSVSLLVGSIWCLFRTGRRLVWLVPGGMLLGLASQTRITMLLFLPALGIWTLATTASTGSWKRALLAVALILCSFSLVYLPLKTIYGGTAKDKSVRSEILGQIYLGVTLKSPPDIDPSASRLAREWACGRHIVAEAGGYQLWHRLLFTKILGFWYPLHNANNGAYYLFDYSLFFIAPFFLTGLLHAPRDATFWLFVAVFATVYVTILLFLYGYPRHRFSADLSLIPIGAWGLHYTLCGEATTRLRTGAVAVYGALALVLVGSGDWLISVLRGIYHGSM